MYVDNIKTDLETGLGGDILDVSFKTRTSGWLF
jgi:hypothetical protein